MASGLYRFFNAYRYVLAGFLDATGGEIIFQSVFQQLGGIPGDDSLSRGAVGHDSCFAQLRSQARTAIPRRDSFNSWGNCSYVTEDSCFTLVLDRSSVIGSNGNLQFYGALLDDA